MSALRFTKRVRKTYKKKTQNVDKVPRALTITTGKDWCMSKTSDSLENPYLRNCLVSLQELLVKHGVSEYKFTMELYDKHGKPTKLHFHGYVSEISREALRDIKAEFGFIQNKPMTDKEGWEAYITKQTPQVRAKIGVDPLISQEIGLERYVNKYEQLAEMLEKNIPLDVLYKYFNSIKY